MAKIVARIFLLRVLFYRGIDESREYLFKVADLNFGCATFCALPSFDAVTTFSSHTTFSSNKVNVKGSDIDMCSAIYFLFDHNTKYYTIYLCPHTVLATVWLSPRRLGNRTRLYATVRRYFRRQYYCPVPLIPGTSIFWGT